MLLLCFMFYKSKYIKKEVISEGSNWRKEERRCVVKSGERQRELVGGECEIKERKREWWEWSMKEPRKLIESDMCCSRHISITFLPFKGWLPSKPY